MPESNELRIKLTIVAPNVLGASFSPNLPGVRAFLRALRGSGLISRVTSLDENRALGLHLSGQMEDSHADLARAFASHFGQVVPPVNLRYWSHDRDLGAVVRVYQSAWQQRS